MNNIMWFMRDDKIIGVLCDWDSAEHHRDGVNDMVQSDVARPSDNDEGSLRSERITSRISNQPYLEQPTAALGHRTGTGPFMAMDLLRDDSDDLPLHKYRHDLESFFYIYACAAATYDPNSEVNMWALPAWDLESLLTIGINKKKFLTVPKAYHEVFRNAHGQSKAVVNGPLRQLYRLLTQLESLHSHSQKVLFDANFDCTGDSDVVQAELAEIEKTREATVTYEKFVRILGQPLE